MKVLINSGLVIAIRESLKRINMVTCDRYTGDLIMQRNKDQPKEGTAQMTSNDLRLKNKLDQTKLKGCQLTDESLRATNEMLRLILQCQHAGASTLATIHAQGEQLNNAEGELDAIHADLNKAGDDLSNIERGERCCCCCPHWCFHCGRSKEKESEIWKSGPKKGAKVKVSKKQPKSKLSGKEVKRNGPYIQRITHDKAEDKMEKNVEAVSHHLGLLKGTAIEMNTEVTKQNTQIDGMIKKASANNEKLSVETKRTNNLLKK